MEVKSGYVQSVVIPNAKLIGVSSLQMRKKRLLSKFISKALDFEERLEF